MQKFNKETQRKGKENSISGQKADDINNMGEKLDDSNETFTLDNNYALDSEEHFTPYSVRSQSPDIFASDDDEEITLFSSEMHARTSGTQSPDIFLSGTSNSSPENTGHVTRSHSPDLFSDNESTNETATQVTPDMFEDQQNSNVESEQGTVEIVDGEENENPNTENEEISVVVETESGATAISILSYYQRAVTAVESASMNVVHVNKSTQSDNYPGLNEETETGINSDVVHYLNRVSSAIARNRSPINTSPENMTTTASTSSVVDLDQTIFLPPE